MNKNIAKLEKRIYGRGKKQFTELIGGAYKEAREFLVKEGVVLNKYDHYHILSRLGFNKSDRMNRIFRRANRKIYRIVRKDLERVSEREFFKQVDDLKISKLIE